VGEAGKLLDLGPRLASQLVAGGAHLEPVMLRSIQHFCPFEPIPPAGDGENFGRTNDPGG